jgi:hypothetical protein
MTFELNSSLFSVLLAVTFFPVVPLLHIILIRFFKNKQSPFYFLVCSCLFYGLTWFGSVFYIIGFSSTFGAEMIGGFSTVAFFSLGYAEIFSMVCRGFSLRIMIDTFLRGPLTIDQVVSNYGDGQGVDWMIKKRISGIESMGLVKWKNNQLVISSNQAFLFGKLGLWFKRTLKLGLGG